jgi:hypothetical protein
MTVETGAKEMWGDEPELATNLRIEEWALEERSGLN